MKKRYLSLLVVLLSIGLMAQEQAAYSSQYEETKEVQEEESAPQQKEQKEKKPFKASDFFTGFSGGMLLHIGYSFSDNPKKLFSNTGLGSYDYLKGLPSSGVCIGLGGLLRAHLLDCIHLGAEGGVSTMPLMGTGSNIRTGWGGALCDYYFNKGKLRPFLGLGIGGGAIKKIYVPEQAEEVNYSESTDGTHYNASYTKTSFFYMDPYVGLEIGLRSHMALIIRLDYMLPFGNTSSKLADNVKWSNFVTPSGPRLYVGVMFGKLTK